VSLFPELNWADAAATEDVADVLSKNERLTLLRLLKKLGKHAAQTRKRHKGAT
jgi:hypothetical protein